MARINLLDDITINKIAAGEVVDRPASIIKELVENAIDAGSTNLTVEVENGGKDLIRIIDNGCGIDKDDINKAFMRHATSKIIKAEDLYDLNSLGFRGEALASISSVSKLEMTTKTKDALMGVNIILEGGKIQSKEPVASNSGTQINVRDLFFNTPARRKFLKSNQAESMAITSLMNKLAIGNSTIKIKYVNNKKTVFETLGDGSLFNLIRLLYGSDVSNNLIKIDYESKYFKIDGYIANNNVYRSNRNLQHIFVNGRFVKSSNIMNVINDSYKAIIPINKYPIYFINLKMDPATIDVNIHPNKLEVKFDKEKEVLSELMDYIRGVLLKNSLIGKYKSPIQDKKVDLYKNVSVNSNINIEHDLNKNRVDANNNLHSTDTNTDVNSLDVNTKDKNTVDIDIIDGNKYTPTNDVSTYNSFMYTEKEQIKNELESISKPLKTLSDINISYNKEFGKDYLPNKNTPSKKDFEPLKDGDEKNVYKTLFEKTDNKSYDDFSDISNFKTLNSIDYNIKEDTLSDFKTLNNLEEYNSGNRSDLVNSSVNTTKDIVKNVEQVRSYIDDKVKNVEQVRSDIDDTVKNVEQVRLDIDDKVRNKDFLNLNYLGIVFDTYILFQRGDELIMMDQHAAHERVRFEMYMEKFKRNEVSIQMLIEPIVMDLSVSDMEITSKNLDKFERFGFMVEEYGHRSISIRGVPNTFGTPESQRFIYEIIDNLDSLGNLYDTKYDDIAEIACKSSIKANDKISYREAMELVKKLQVCENPYTCPHGRPILVSMTKYDIEKMFKRKGI